MKLLVTCQSLAYDIDNTKDENFKIQKKKTKRKTKDRITNNKRN